MNVCMAVQIVSSSVADALQYLKNVDSSFANVEATIKFIRIFDIQNTRSTFGRGYKAPWSLKNQSRWETYFKKSAEYMKTLNVDGVSIFHIKTGFCLCGLFPFARIVISNIQELPLKTHEPNIDLSLNERFRFLQLY